MKLPHITNKQKEILHLHNRFRYLNRIQIQTLLHHKNPKTINTWLKDLTDKKYLGRFLDNKGKVNIIPATYYLAKNGIRFLRTQPRVKSSLIKLYKDATRSKWFIDHCQLIAEMYLTLLNKHTISSGFAFYTQNDYTRDGIIKEIFPHFVFRKRKNEPYYVVEMFREKMPRKRALNPRIVRYISFFTQGEWIENELPPNILFICPDEKMENYVVKHTQEVLVEENVKNLTVYTTTLEKIRENGIVGDVWREIEMEEE